MRLLSAASCTVTLGMLLLSLGAIACVSASSSSSSKVFVLPMTFEPRSPNTRRVVQQPEEEEDSLRATTAPLTVFTNGAWQVQINIGMLGFDSSNQVPYQSIPVTVDTGSPGFFVTEQVLGPVCTPAANPQFQCTAAGCPPGAPPSWCCGGTLYGTPSSQLFYYMCQTTVQIGSLSLNNIYLGSAWTQRKVLSSLNPGIMGLGFQSNPPDFFSQVVTATQIANVFSIFMCPWPQNGPTYYNAGNLILGAGIDSTTSMYYQAGSPTLTVPFYPGGTFYQVDIVDVLVNNQPLGQTSVFANYNVGPVVGINDGVTYQPKGALNSPTGSNIIDSGWTGFGLDATVFNALKTAFNNLNFNNVIGRTAYYEDIALLPTISFVLQGSGATTVTLTLQPSDYMWPTGLTTGGYQFVGVQSPPGTGNGIGSAFMNAYFTAFDRAANTVSFVLASATQCANPSSVSPPQTSCFNYPSCSTCNGDSSCGWCGASQQCMPSALGNKGGPSQGTCLGHWVSRFQNCLSTCVYPTCSLCTLDSTNLCGWGFSNGPGTAICSQQPSCENNATMVCAGKPGGVCPGPTSMPSIDPPTGGIYGGNIYVTLTADAGATIYYTTDGTAPTTLSTQYSSPFKIAGPTSAVTVSAIASKDGSPSSWPRLAVYKLTAQTSAVAVPQFGTCALCTENGLGWQPSTSTCYDFSGSTQTFQSTLVFHQQNCPSASQPSPPAGGCSPLTPQGCDSCTKQGCGWCQETGVCAQQSGGCAPTEWVAPGNTGQCDVCQQYTNLGCNACTSHAGCGWCNSTQQCLEGTISHTTNPQFACPRRSWLFGSGSCGGDPCMQFTDCPSCDIQADALSCGWCQAAGLCLTGNAAFAASPAFSGQCSGSAWFFDNCGVTCKCDDTVCCDLCPGATDCSSGDSCKFDGSCPSSCPEGCNTVNTGTPPLPKGAIAGIVIGCVFFVAAVVGVIAYFKVVVPRRRNLMTSAGVAMTTMNSRP